MDEIIHKFSEWLEVDEPRKRGTIEHHVSWKKRLLKECSNYPLKIEDNTSFLKKWKGKVGVYHYSNLVKLSECPRAAWAANKPCKSFKLPRIDRPTTIIKKKIELQGFYYAGLSRLDDRAFFLLVATSGLRRHEATDLKLKDVDLETGMIVQDKADSKVMA